MNLHNGIANCGLRHHAKAAGSSKQHSQREVTDMREKH